MKTICLFSPGILPIPAVKGGAIETLLELLIEHNEIEKKVRFLVVSVHDEEAEARSQKYKQTDFIYIKRNLLFAGAYKAVKVLMRKLFLGYLGTTPNLETQKEGKFEDIG